MRYLVFIAVLFTTFYCRAQLPNFNQGITTTRNYYTEIPYQQIHGAILIDVELAGKKHRFLFDTGAPTAISENLVKQLDLKAFKKVSLQDGGGRSDSVTFVQLKGLKIGDVTFYGTPAIGSVPKFFDCMQAEGIIGSNLVRNSIVSLQSDRHVMVITDQPDKLKLDKTHASPMGIDDKQSQPYITLKNGDGSMTMPFDTGMDGFISLEESMMKGVQATPNSEKYMVVIDKGFGANIISMFGLQPDADKYRVKFPMLQLGDAKFENVFAQTDKDIIPVIGSHLLNYGNATLDYINRQFYYDPRINTTDLSEKNWPFDITIKDNKVVVSMIWSAGKDLVKLGEQVLKVDETDVAHVDDCDLIKPSPLKDKTSATLVIKDAQGKTRKVKMSKQ